MKNVGCKSVTTKVISVLCGLLVVLAMSVTAGYCKDKFIDSGEYKKENFKKICIADYAEMHEGGDIKWVWVDPGIKLADYKVKVKSFEDRSDEIKSSQLGDIKKLFVESFEKTKGASGVLNAVICIYEVQKFSAGKAWIPFAGGHKMQAGVGAEMTLSTKEGKIVAKFRHFAREGAQIELAAEEVADDLRKFINQN